MHRRYWNYDTRSEDNKAEKYCCVPMKLSAILNSDNTKCSPRIEYILKKLNFVYAVTPI